MTSNYPDVESGNTTNGEDSTPARNEFVHPRSLLNGSSWLFVGLILLTGFCAAGIILGFGLSSAKQDEDSTFERVSKDLLTQVDTAFNDYVLAGLWMHQTTVLPRHQTHEDFRLAYEYIVSSGLNPQSMSWVRNTSHSERPAMENETRAYLLQSDYPFHPYLGFLGLEFSSDFITPGPRSPQPSYFVLHFVEPMEDPLTRNALHLDMNSLPPHRKALGEALSTWKPATTERLKLAPEFGQDAYFVIVFHPGTKVPSMPDLAPRDLTALAVDIKDVILRAQNTLTNGEDLSLYVYDSTDTPDDDPPFLGAAVFAGDRSRVDFIPELPKSDIPKERHSVEIVLEITSRKWTFVVTSAAYRPDTRFVFLGATLIFVACLGLALWLRTTVRRAVLLNDIQAAAEAEKTSLLIENSRRERELNDFIAHGKWISACSHAWLQHVCVLFFSPPDLLSNHSLEVRNPLSAALSACSFVSSAVHERLPLQDEDSRQSVRQDVDIIDTSLNFVNDLLRSMLDVHRVSSNQLQINKVPTDIMRDIFEPTGAMLYRRGIDFNVLFDCPENLVVMTDRLRLQQIILNLGRNAAKFVTTGFVRFRATMAEEQQLTISVEDSGPGIPESKQDLLFSKFQESLDSLNQGTGVGLFLCKKLVFLLNGELRLDKEYDSGMAGFPGARFVLHFNDISLVTADMLAAHEENIAAFTYHGGSSSSPEHSPTLPEEMAVLFVDDDLILRKLFLRSIRKCFPQWTVEEAASGETCLQVVASRDFDLIFLDQFMASTDKQMLGTETARALRARGVQSIICGLSANDMESAFLEAGADCFRMKPLPCEKPVLSQELQRIISTATRR